MKVAIYSFIPDALDDYPCRPGYIYYILCDAAKYSNNEEVNRIFIENDRFGTYGLIKVIDANQDDPNHGYLKIESAEIIRTKGYLFAEVKELS